MTKKRENFANFGYNESNLKKIILLMGILVLIRILIFGIQVDISIENPIHIQNEEYDPCGFDLDLGCF